jgi:dolichol-phosphate mannosyltransferase
MVTIVLPTYNERRNLEGLVRSIVRLQRASVIIVDDNSPDGTGELAERLAGKFPIRVIHREKRMGLSSAVVAGFKASKDDIIGVMDADLSHPPEALPRMIKLVAENRADIVVGSRKVEGGRVEVWPLSRRIMSWGATMLARPLTDVRDPMSGFFVLRRRVIKDVELSSRGYKILLEVLVKGNYRKAVEVPYVFKNRGVGQSKLGPRQYFQYLTDLSRLYFFKVFG